MSVAPSRPWKIIRVVAVAVAIGTLAGILAASLNSSADGPPSLPTADGFQLPFGDGTASATYVSTHGVSFTGWYVAAGFLDQTYLRDRGALHPGEDWNGVGGGDTDLGQPVLAAAAGRVESIELGAPGWGNVMMLRHVTLAGETVFTVYAHVEHISVVEGELVRRGERLAKVGKGERDRYWAHVHLEVRKANMAYFPPSFWPSSHDLDSDWVRTHYYEPRAFLSAHRPPDLFVSTVAALITRPFSPLAPGGHAHRGNGPTSL